MRGQVGLATAGRICQPIKRTESNAHLSSPPGGVHVLVIAELPLNWSRSATI